MSRTAPLSFIRSIALLLGLLVFLFVTPSTDALFSKLAKKRTPVQEEQAPEQKPEYTGKESANMGLQAFQDLFNNPNAMKELLKLQEDPEFMHEVEELMDDPEFQQQVDEYLKNPSTKMGLGTLASAMSNPADVLETMDMLNDPEFAKEVEELMADPSFQEEMKKMAETPLFAEVIEKAKIMADELQKDPAEVEKFLQNVREEMGKSPESAEGLLAGGGKDEL